MKYVEGSKSLGPHTVTAKKIFYTDEVDEDFYSLEGFTIRSRDEQKNYYQMYDGRLACGLVFCIS